MPAVARIEGLNEAVAYLKQFDTQTLKALNKELYSEMKKLKLQTRADAPVKTPLRNWKPQANPKSRWGFVKSGDKAGIAFDPRAVRMGITTELKPVRIKGRDTKERAYLLVENNGGGSVYEAAGRKSRGRTPQGRAFIRNLEAKSGITVIGKQGRLIWKNVIENRNEVTANLAAVVRKYEALINAKLAK